MPPKGKPKRRRRINWCATHRRLDIDDLLVVIGSTIGLSKRESARALVKAFDMGDTSWVPDQAAARAKAAPGAKPRYWRISIMMPSRYRALLFNAVLAAFGLVSVSVIAPAHAAGPELTICGGVIDGRYNKFASDFGAQLRDILVPKVLVTEGSLDNLSKLSSGECAAGLAQADAMFAQQQRDPNFKLIAEVVGTSHSKGSQSQIQSQSQETQVSEILSSRGKGSIFARIGTVRSVVEWVPVTN